MKYFIAILIMAGSDDHEIHCCQSQLLDLAFPFPLSFFYPCNAGMTVTSKLAWGEAFCGSCRMVNESGLYAWEVLLVELYIVHHLPNEEGSMWVPETKRYILLETLLGMVNFLPLS